MKTEHTPGPWKAQEVREQKFYRIIDENGVHVAEVDWFIGMGKELPLQTAAEANAKLIAAAPELLEALRTARVIVICAKREEALKWTGAEGYDKADKWALNHHDVKAIDAAITKATNAH